MIAGHHTGSRGYIRYPGPGVGGESQSTQRGHLGRHRTGQTTRLYDLVYPLLTPSRRLHRGLSIAKRNVVLPLTSSRNHRTVPANVRQGRRSDRCPELIRMGLLVRWPSRQASEIETAQRQKVRREAASSLGSRTSKRKKRVLKFAVNFKRENTLNRIWPHLSASRHLSKDPAAPTRTVASQRGIRRGDFLAPFSLGWVAHRKRRRLASHRSVDNFRQERL